MRKNDKTLLQRIVSELIQTHRKGEYWDFKQEWHERLSDLLKDIICFANTVHDKDCYLIFGVDEHGNVSGMKNGRRKLVEIVDALSKLPLAGDCQPEITIDTVTIQEKEMDVLTIFDTEETPFFLKEDRFGMLAGHIYTRCGDDNTPDTSNAHFSEIEKLWKKRFGLLKTPLDTIYDRLAMPTEWERKNDTYYDMLKPEYQLKLVRDEDPAFPEFYTYAVIDSQATYMNLYLRCHKTTLEKFQIVSMEGGRYLMPVPEWGYVGDGPFQITQKYEYKYFIEGSEAYKIFQFFLAREDEKGWSVYHRLMEVVLLYHSEKERQRFEDYITSHQGLLEQRYAREERFDAVCAANKFDTQICRNRLRIGLCLNEMLKEFRRNQPEEETA